MILVTTGGTVGSTAARRLAEQDIPVRLVVRAAARAGSLPAAGVEVVVGDLEDPDSVARAMRGVSGVVLVTPPVVRQELNVIDAAVTAEVAHVVKITTTASPDSPIARRRHHAEIERALSASGLAHTLLRSNAYMQNLLATAPTVARSDTFPTATGAGRIGHVDARDVAEAAARIAALPGPHAGQTYRPTGPQALTGAEVAAVLSGVLGRPIADEPISIDQQKRAMLAAGLPEAVAQDNATAVGLMADGDCDYVTGDLAAILGRAPGSLARFVRDQAAAFSAPTSTIAGPA